MRACGLPSRATRSPNAESESWSRRDSLRIAGRLRLRGVVMRRAPCVGVLGASAQRRRRRAGGGPGSEARGRRSIRSMEWNGCIHARAKLGDMPARMPGALGGISECVCSVLRGRAREPSKHPQVVVIGWWGDAQARAGAARPATAPPSPRSAASAERSRGSASGRRCAAPGVLRVRGRCPVPRARNPRTKSAPRAPRPRAPPPRSRRPVTPRSGRGTGPPGPSLSPLRSLRSLRFSG